MHDADITSRTMKNFHSFFFLIIFLHAAASCAANCQTSDGRLKDLTGADQQIRDDWYKLLHNPNTTSIEKENFVQRWRAIDAADLTELKEIISACGWPQGQAASHDAWLLAQHADKDVAFQHQAKAMLEAALKNGTASAQDLAYLSDRIAIAEGRPQEYGTQFSQPDRCHVKMQPIDSAELVNQRRRAIGLESLEEYEAQGRKVFIAADCPSDQAVN